MNVSEVNSKRYCTNMILLLFLSPITLFEKCIKLVFNKGGGGEDLLSYSPAIKEISMVTCKV